MASNDNMELMVIRTQELVENPTARVPVCLVLDTSGSMSGDPIRELSEGVNLFFEAIKDNEVARYSAEIAIVTFGGSATKALDFAGIDSQVVPTLYASGNTPMNEGVNMALDLLEQRKNEYKSYGVQYYQPWMVLMTDGAPDSYPAEAIQRTVELVNARKLSIFPIGIGTGADMSMLQNFSPNKPPLRLKGLSFKAFFEWLSQSVSRVSQSVPGDVIVLDVNGISSWGTP